MDIHPEKPIFYPSSYYDRSNYIRLTWSGTQVEDYTTHNCLEFYQYADHDIIINRRQSVSGIIHTIIGITFCWKIQIQPYVASGSTNGEIRYMYKDVSKYKAFCRYMEDLALHTCAPTLHWEDNTSCIYFVEDKTFTPRVNQIDKPVCFL